MSLFKREQQAEFTPSSRVTTQISDLIRMAQLAGYIKLPKHNIKNQHKGTMLSAFKGRGMELADIRRYQDGDDVRDLNWLMYARTGDLYTKLYHEERERPSILWVDHSSSMQFATRGSYKAVVASQLAALVGWHEIKNNNRIGGINVDDCTSKHWRASKSKQGFMQFLQQLCVPKPAMTVVDKTAETLSLSQKIAGLTQVKQPGSGLYLFSDFTGWDDDCEKQLLRLSQHQDILLTMILDPIELQLPSKGIYTFSNGKDQTTIDTSKVKSLVPYYQKIKERIERVAHMSSYPNIDCSYVLTNDNPIEACYQSLNNLEPKFTIGGLK